MSDPQLSPGSAARVIDQLFLGSRLLCIEPILGDFANLTDVLVARLPQGRERRVVVHRYRPFGDYDRGQAHLCAAGLVQFPRAAGPFKALYRAGPGQNRQKLVPGS